ncbi:MAG: GPR endopeptidase [Clostridiales bacterium]|nr:GPR endopeptidase [Clostridiales bacterium]
MEKNFKIRTDLALEARENFIGNEDDISGITVEETYQKEKQIKITRVIIKNKVAAEAIKKPIGTYITLEAVNMDKEDEEYHREISQELSKHILDLLPKKYRKSILIVGLGNRDVTPDALGPNVVGNLYVTRHLIKEFGYEAFKMDNLSGISSIIPGVMAQTGMETSEIVKGIVMETKPTAIIAIDALAARNTNRLNTTIQLSDTGINPGSGVGNHRKGLTEETLGVPVIAIGVPTVVDAATIVNDTMENLIIAMEHSKRLKAISSNLSELDEDDKHRLIYELLDPKLKAMFVTPKDIDETVKRISFTISEALNIAFVGGK